MVLPGNGRIVIIDDKINQALPLINYLSKNGLPFKYFNGDLDNLPEADRGFDDIRILFLDFNLMDDAIPDKTHFAKIKAVLNRIIKSVSHPYLLVAWTRHDEHIEQLNEYVFDHHMDHKKPFSILKANKMNFFSLDGEENHDADFNDLKSELSEKLSEFVELECLFKWENIIHDITNEIGSDFFSPEPTYIEWANKTKSILNSFALASIGRHYDTSDSTTKVNAAFEVIHQLLMDKLETKFYSLEHNIDFVNSEPNREISNTEINTKLLTGHSIKNDNRYPGLVVKCEDTDLKEKVFKKIVTQFSAKKYFEDSPIKSNFTELAEHKRKEIFKGYCKEKGLNISQIKMESHLTDLVDLYSEIDVKFNELNQDAQRIASENAIQHLLVDSIFIEVCIDPLCDYVQKKSIYPKMINGLLLPKKIEAFIDKNTEALYISPSFKFGRDEVFLVVDYRYLKTLNNEDQKNINEQDILFRIRSTLLADIQSKLSRHINRQGILYL
ncbi:hypothetical protein V6380_07150 [Acinetobacter variabilis]|uniref:hypothetical protein n=1 Tax=Acinetobacter variabilis TaxID=70346 RepID=UPI003B8442BC